MASALADAQVLGREEGASDRRRRGSDRHARRHLTGAAASTEASKVVATSRDTRHGARRGAPGARRFSGSAPSFDLDARPREEKDSAARRVKPSLSISLLPRRVALHYAYVPHLPPGLWSVLIPPSKCNQNRVGLAPRDRLGAHWDPDSLTLDLAVAPA